MRVLQRIARTLRFAAGSESAGSRPCLPAFHPPATTSHIPPPRCPSACPSMERQQVKRRSTMDRAAAVADEALVPIDDLGGVYQRCV